MARTVFFSFHYQRDIMRVEQVKRHYLTKGTYTGAGFFNGSLEEKAKAQGDAVVKKMIDDGMNGSSVLCVLIGKETYTRRWVDYEILRAIDRGMGVFGIRINKLKHPRPQGNTDWMDGSDNPGSSPFDFLKYTETSGTLQPMIQYQTGWKNAPYQTTINTLSAPPYLRSQTGLLSSFLLGPSDINLNSIFKVYDWVSDNGFNNFGTWVEAAAKQGGR